VKGAPRETWGDVTNAANEVKESQQEAAATAADEKRGEVSLSIEDAKDKAKGKIEDFKERHTA
jgi:uncharacterized protein YjbJ (UPF0337 family)